MNKITKEVIEAKIKKIIYRRISEKLTHCILTLENGFEVTGESACVDPANYNSKIGERIAYENAFEKIWVIEGYLLQEKLWIQKNLAAALDKIPKITREEFHKAFSITSEEAFAKNPSVVNKQPYGKNLTEAIFQKPFVPEECCTERTGPERGKRSSIPVYEEAGDVQELMNKIVPKTSPFDQRLKELKENSEADSKQKTCTCLDWKKFPQVKKMMFKEMFPEATDFDYSVLTKEPGADFNWVRLQTLAKNKLHRETVFSILFPDAPAGAFQFADGRVVLADRNKSFVEKFEQLADSAKSDRGNTLVEPGAEFDIKTNKLVRNELEVIFKTLGDTSRKSPQRSTALRKIKEARMWLGDDLRDLGDENPYPNGNDSANSTVDPIAEELKV